MGTVLRPQRLVLCSVLCTQHPITETLSRRLTLHLASISYPVFVKYPKTRFLRLNRPQLLSARPCTTYQHTCHVFRLAVHFEASPDERLFIPYDHSHLRQLLTDPMSNTVMVITVVTYDYGKQYFCACYSSQTEMRVLLPCCQSSCFHERYIINLFCSCHLIRWLTMLKDRLCLGEEATIMKQGLRALWFHSTDPGPRSPQYLFWCVKAHGHPIAYVLN